MLNITAAPTTVLSVTDIMTFGWQALLPLPCSFGIKKIFFGPPKPSSKMPQKSEMPSVMHYARFSPRTHRPCLPSLVTIRRL